MKKENEHVEVDICLSKGMNSFSIVYGDSKQNEQVSMGPKNSSLHRVAHAE